MTKTQPRTRIQEKNRKTILDAGLDVFSKYGFRGSTLDQIAEAAGLSKPNLLYYFPSKEAIHVELLEMLLDTWLDPLREMEHDGDPIEEILSYVHRKIEMSREYPRESRLFANEILQGAPRILDALSDELKPLVDEKCALIRQWISEGRIAEVDPYHLIFSIWSMTQHYADFAVQVDTIMEGKDPFDGAQKYLDYLFISMLTPK
ncbi:TetR family transcriptional regulator [Marivivens donghaensis]|uniref:TetR family transcriptional regulator n=1 Tax=Marivivens donghaensis TaxID=1699413 RepID=A0ABX0VWW5_9RHOB|nr:TetR family transcriptional regulator C-terminal domain-containing protein [Marivivens donghaensis]NIY71394.1 TetR family transcriptional regulator [Marivivens donghaensis]